MYFYTFWYTAIRFATVLFLVVSTEQLPVVNAEPSVLIVCCRLCDWLSIIQLYVDYEGQNITEKEISLKSNKVFGRNYYE